MSEIETLRDENFCLAFELEAMADLLLRGEGERWVPRFCDSIVETEHLQRYNWASKFVSGKQVLDMACGCGYGTFLLASQGGAKTAIGCDISAKAIRYASIRNQHRAVKFIEGNAESFKPDEAIDLVVSFETIEHLPDVESFLGNVRSLLKKDGIFLVSTPISRMPEDPKPANPFHLREWGFLEFQKLIARFFEVEKVYVQLRIESRPFKLQGFNWAIRRARKVYDSLICQKKAHVKALAATAPMAPIEWNESIFPVEMMAGRLAGFQILVCRKRP